MPNLEGRQRALWETGPRAPRAGQSSEVPGHKEAGAHHMASGTGVEVQSLFFSHYFFPSPLLTGRRPVKQEEAQIALREGKGPGVRVG